MSTLGLIRNKVRRLTGRPSEQQITLAQVDEYINTFYLYDMPETLRLFDQKTIFQFMTEANVDTYDMRNHMVTDDAGSSTLYRAADVYNNLIPPAYVAGYQVMWTQSREQLFIQYPAIAQLNQTLEGDGTAGPYSVTFANTPILQRSVSVGAIDNTETVINLVDEPVNRRDGDLYPINTMVPTAISPFDINYLTGVVTVTFSNAIPIGNEISFSGVPYVANRPQAILFFDNILTMRPIPDASYLIRIDAYKRPTSLLATNTNPQLTQWWQYIAFGTALKIFEDQQDMDGYNQIMPMFMKQESLVLRRTIVQQTNQRTSTIYTEGLSFPYGNNNNQF